MPNLILHRDSGWVDGWRKYSVWLDGRNVGQIRDGEKMVVPISPGEHTLQARIDWCRTKDIPFLVAEADVVFHVKSGLRGWRMILTWVYFFLPWKWISLELTGRTEA